MHRPAADRCRLPRAPRDRIPRGGASSRQRLGKGCGDEGNAEGGGDRLPRGSRGADHAEGAKAVGGEVGGG